MQFRPGDKVFALTGQHAFWSTYGTYAQYVCAAESTLQPLPRPLSFHEAAAVPLAAMTAWQAMEPSMPLEGKRVLVHAGAGGSVFVMLLNEPAVALRRCACECMLGETRQNTWAHPDCHKITNISWCACVMVVGTCSRHAQHATDCAGQDR